MPRTKRNIKVDAKTMFWRKTTADALADCCVDVCFGELSHRIPIGDVLPAKAELATCQIVVLKTGLEK